MDGGGLLGVDSLGEFILGTIADTGTPTPRPFTISAILGGRTASASLAGVTVSASLSGATISATVTVNNTS